MSLLIILAGGVTGFIGAWLFASLRRGIARRRTVRFDDSLDIQIALGPIVTVVIVAAQFGVAVGVLTTAFWFMGFGEALRVAIDFAIGLFGGVVANYVYDASRGRKTTAQILSELREQPIQDAKKETKD